MAGYRQVHRWVLSTGMHAYDALLNSRNHMAHMMLDGTRIMIMDCVLQTCVLGATPWL